VLIVVFLVQGLEDLVIDIIFFSRRIFRAIFRRKVVKPVTPEQLSTVSEKPLAILIPAWDESAVITRMLLNTVGTLNYRNYHIFVGCYPNDASTREAVDKAAEVYPNIQMALVSHDGPTNKADCLNCVFDAVRTFEREKSIVFEIFVLHDAEDVVHPESLKFYNYLIPRFNFIQIPVFALPTPWYSLVAGVYMDEFAENHTKELRVRELVTGGVPSAGVGTALSRKATDFLAERHNGEIFDPGSVTEDYLLGLKLMTLPGRKILLQQAVPTADGRSAEPVATREYFPSSFWRSVRQKARWVLGISLQGWSAGWGRTFGQNYWLWRDRKAFVLNILVVAGYILVVFWVGTEIFNHYSETTKIPPLIEVHEPYMRLVWIVLAIFGWRVLNRVAATARLYGILHGIMAVPRLVVGNFINFCASVMAIGHFVRAKFSGTTPKWEKTAHIFPPDNHLRRYHKRLGEILVDRHLVTSAQIDAALARQKETHQKLGEILLATKAITPKQLEITIEESAK
jgi:adsorption protein B